MPFLLALLAGRHRDGMLGETILPCRESSAPQGPLQRVACHDAAMPEFRVMCYEAHEWNQATARVVKARDEKAAAERVCGGPLVARGKIGQLRAQVSPVSKRASKTLFYVPA